MAVQYRGGLFFGLGRNKEIVWKKGPHRANGDGRLTVNTSVNPFCMKAIFKGKVERVFSLDNWQPLTTIRLSFGGKRRANHACLICEQKQQKN